MVNSAELNSVLRREIHDRVILDVEIRSAEIQFLPRIDEFCLAVVRNFLHQRYEAET